MPPRSMMFAAAGSMRYVIAYSNLLRASAIIMRLQE
jgi:hypothetical protein